MTETGNVRFEKPVEWARLIAATNSVAAYRGITTAAFSDGKVNDGRLYVLEVYTSDVCAKYPDISEAIRTYYSQLYPALASRVSRPKIGYIFKLVGMILESIYKFV